MNRQDFLEGMSHAACTVSVITTDGRQGVAGVTVSAMSSVSDDPPSLLVCVHHQSKACEALRGNGVFCVNVLSDEQAHISDTFAGRRPAHGGDQFACADWVKLVTGAPVLENALVNFDCRISNSYRHGSHYIFIAEIVDIRHRRQGNPLIYANRAYGKPAQLDRFSVDRKTSSGGDEILRIGCFVTLGLFFMPRLIASFLTKHPRAEFELYEGVQNQLRDGLHSRLYDLALMYDVEPDDLDKRLVAEVDPHVLLPAGHPLAALSRISLEDVVDEPMVLLDIPPSQEYFTSLFEQVGLKPSIAFRSSSLETVRGMVGNGLGYTVLVSKPANSMSYDGKAVVSRPITESVSPGRIVLARAKDGQPSGLLMEFADHCAAQFECWK